MFAGTIANIPEGWALCDGNNGTPDLRDKFVIGAGVTFAVGATGGVTAHNHPFTGDGHTHEMPDGTEIASGAIRSGTSDSNFARGNTDNTDSLPPYYALAYMMKV